LRLRTRACCLRSAVAYGFIRATALVYETAAVTLTINGHSPETRHGDTKVEVDDWSPKPLQLLLHTNCAAPGIQLRDRVKGTKRTSMAERVFVLPSVIFSTTVSC
jgi:hypothetical protein